MIRLTALTKVLTEAAEKKLDELENQFMTSEQQEQEDEYWANLGLPNPNRGDKPRILGEGEIEFVDEDFETVESIALVKPSRIDLILSVKDGSEVFMESKKSITVRETPEEIETLIAQGR